MPGTTAAVAAPDIAEAGSSTSFGMEGQCFATVTPFEEGTERLDKEAMAVYLKYLWDQGGRNIVTNGTTGEFAAMTLAERKAALETARQHWPGVILNNISSCCLADCLDLLEHSQHSTSSDQGRRTLADAVLILPPFYLAGAPDEGNEVFLRKILQASPLPVYLYNFPANTNCLISPSMYGRLARDYKNLRGVKNTFQDTPLAKQFKDAAPHCQVYVGADTLSIATLEAGMDGVIGGGGSSIMAGIFVQIWHLYKQGRHQEAQALQDRMNDWSGIREKLGVMDIPAGKAGLHLSVPTMAPTCRAPLLSPSAEQAEVMDNATRIAMGLPHGAN